PRKRDADYGGRSEGPTELPVLHAGMHRADKELANECLLHPYSWVGNCGQERSYTPFGGCSSHMIRRVPRNYVLRAYVAALAVLALILAAILIRLDIGLGSPWTVLALAFAAAIAERGTVRLSETTELSISPVLTLFAAVLF